MFTLLKQRRLRWLGHVKRMQDGRIPKDILYGGLTTGKRNTDRTQLRYKDTVKRAMKAIDFHTESWESLADDHSKWKGPLKKHLKSGEEKRTNAASQKRARRKESSGSNR